MTAIKAISRRVSQWMDESWISYGSAAMLAFFIGFAVVFVLTVWR